MNKTVRILLAIALLLAFAAPALAEFKFNGYYRVIGYNEEKKNSDHDYGNSQQFIDQRFRGKLTYTLNDNVAVVYFAEVDTTWGENNKAALGQGGQSYSWAGGADGVNVETKQVYLDLKSGDTAAQLGIIGVADAFESIVANDDMAGLQVTHKMGNTSLKFAYSKWDEDDSDTPSPETEVTRNNNRGYWDDFDFYLAEVSHKFNDQFRAGAGVYWMDNNSNDTPGSEYDWDAVFFGLNGTAKFDNFTIDGFVMGQTGEKDYKASGKKDQDIEGWAATVKATYKLENGDIGLRVIYFSDDDNTRDIGAWQGFKGQYAFVKENQMQFLTDPYVMNDGKERYAEADAVQGGFGLLGFVLSGNHKLPQDMYLNWGAGYYRAVDDKGHASGVEYEACGKTLGYELAARIGKKFFEKVDLSFNASFADYGSFYDNTVKDKSGHYTKDPDATYKSYLMVNVPF